MARTDAFKQSHSERIVAPRLSVLTGEVLHQLRSSLDHLVRALILCNGGTPKKSQFPIWDSEPVDKKNLKDYEKQIAGIKNEAVRQKLWQLQPWQTTANRWLWDLGELNNQDKHRSLILHVTVVEPRVRYTTTWADNDVVGESDSVDDGSEITAGVQTVFGETIERTNIQRRLVVRVELPWSGAPGGTVDLVSSLQGLCNAVRKLIDEFAPFFRDASQSRAS
jgi:hypothetical protein